MFWSCNEEEAEIQANSRTLSRQRGTNASRAGFPIQHLVTGLHAGQPTHTLVYFVFNLCLSPCKLCTRMLSSLIPLILSVTYNCLLQKHRFAEPPLNPDFLNLPCIFLPLELLFCETCFNFSFFFYDAEASLLIRQVSTE